MYQVDCEGKIGIEFDLFLFGQLFGDDGCIEVVVLEQFQVYVGQFFEIVGYVGVYYQCMYCYEFQYQYCIIDGVDGV